MSEMREGIAHGRTMTILHTFLPRIRGDSTMRALIKPRTYTVKEDITAQKTVQAKICEKILSQAGSTTALAKASKPLHSISIAPSFIL